MIRVLVGEVIEEDAIGVRERVPELVGVDALIVLKIHVDRVRAWERRRTPSQPGDADVAAPVVAPSQWTRVAMRLKVEDAI